MAAMWTHCGVLYTVIVCSDLATSSLAGISLDIKRIETMDLLHAGIRQHTLIRRVLHLMIECIGPLYNWFYSLIIGTGLKFNKDW
jgi:hypothetical protein